MSAFFAGIQNILSFVPASLLLTECLLSHLSTELHSFLPLLYFKTFLYSPCDSWSFLPIISSLRIVSKFPTLSFCFSTYVCVCACVQGVCVVGGFGYHKASKKISHSKQTPPEKIRKFGLSSSHKQLRFILKNFTFCTLMVFMCVFTDLIKIAVIFLYSLNWFVLGILYE